MRLRRFAMACGAMVDAPLTPAGAPPRPAAGLARGAAAVRERFVGLDAAPARSDDKSALADEAPRAALWAPVAIGAGAVGYFSLRAEPAAWFAPLALVFLAALAWSAREGPRAPLTVAAALVAFGFAAADVRTHRVAAPILGRDVGIVDVEGRLVAIDERVDGRRLTIRLENVGRVAAEATPRLARVTWRGAEFDAAPGDRIALRAGLRPPPPPAAPGGFDFARRLYFRRIGAVGFAVTPPRVLAGAPAVALGARFASLVETARGRLAARIVAAGDIADPPSTDGLAIVAAVVTGKRGAVSEEAQNALRDAGLAHLLAISGLHMGLAAGLIFFVARAALATSERLTLDRPIKKWSACLALAASFGYLILSGAGWSARRAFIMTAIVFIAMIADRRALSLRNVAVAATIILVTTPEAVLEPGFQMSFAAVTALIAAYEWFSTRRAAAPADGWRARLKRYVVGGGVTDTIAATATAPFGLYHFHRAAAYSLPANLIAAPLMAFWIMPAAVAALALAPLNLDAPVWRLAARGVDVVLAVARAVSGAPGAIVTTPIVAPLALGIVTLGGLWFCLTAGRKRLAGLAAAPLALMLAPVPTPVVFVAADGDNAALADGDRLYAFHPRRDRFAQVVWLEHLGAAPAPAGAMSDVGRCDAAGCVAPTAMGPVAFTDDPLALADDCARAGLVVAFFPAPKGARETCAAALVDRRDAWRAGAHAIYRTAGAPRVVSVADRRGARPWTGGAPQ
ncbi:MAG: ComEC/Rec2 family competence protein [Parvularculaceae bacterium]